MPCELAGEPDHRAEIVHRQAEAEQQRAVLHEFLRQVEVGEPDGRPDGGNVSRYQRYDGESSPHEKDHPRQRQ